MKTSRFLRVPVVAVAVFLSAYFLPLQASSEPLPDVKTEKFLTDLNFGGVITGLSRGWSSSLKAARKAKV
jgi:hypothetical protein